MNSNIDKWHRYGRELQEHGQLVRAEEIYRYILNIAPNRLRSLNNLAVLLITQGRLLESQLLLDEAFMQAETRWSTEAFENHIVLAEELALLLNTRCQLALHMDHFEYALCLAKIQIKIYPQTSGLANLGIALSWLNKSVASRRSQWLGLVGMNSSYWPDDPVSTSDYLWLEEESSSASASRHVQICNLATGILSRDPLDRDGWQMLLARLATEPWVWDDPVKVWHGLWNGESIDHVLLWDEQGYGDALQCLRWVPASCQRVKSVTLLLRPSLVELVKQRLSLPPNCHIYPLDIYKERPWARTAVHCPLMGLPVALYPPGSKIPITTTPVLRKEFYLKSKVRRLGVVWAAGQKDNQDAQRSSRFRSVPGDLFLRHSRNWSRNLNAELYSLQLGPELVHARPLIAAGIVTSLECGGDWLQTSRSVEQLDVVITVDTAMVHLAGSLGVPCILLLNHVCDWRWWCGGESVNWYSSVTVLRASSLNDWEGVLQRVPGLIDEMITR